MPKTASPCRPDAGLSTGSSWTGPAGARPACAAWVDFQSYGLGLDLGLFAVGCVLVWLAGTRLSRRAILVAIATIRRERTLLRLGYDSVLVLVLYVGGVVVLYSLR